MFKVNNSQDTRKTSITFGVFIAKFEHKSQLFSTVTVINFEQINAGRELINLIRGVYIFTIMYQLRHYT